MLLRITSFLLIGSILLSSCATILNGKNQKVNIYTNSSEAKVYVDDQLAGKGKVVNAKLKRDFRIKQLRVEAPGYKPQYVTAIQEKKSPLFIMSWIPFGVLFLMPPYMDRGVKSKNYDKEFSIAPQLKAGMRAPNEKYIYLKNTSFEINKEDLVTENYNHRKYSKNKKSGDVATSKEKIDITNSVFTDAINDILKKNNYMDTTQTVFRSKTNSMLLSAKVSKVKFKNISSPNRLAESYTIATNYYFVSELTVEWSLLDIYEQTKYSKTIVSSSGEFANNYDFKEGAYNREYIFNSINDALTISFYDFLADGSVRNLVNVETKKQALASLKILSPSVSTNSLKQAQSATVTVSTKNGHGSGCLISNQGYVVTNYHVVASAKGSVEIILSSGDKYKGSVVRVNEDADLALLSIENAPANLSYYNLPLESAFEVGDEVFAIGTPKSIELSQTLSKGIISGLRKLPDNTRLIQTDVSVNSGNSGGALVSKDGKLIGIVNSKLIGQGVEGIAFCLPANEIRKSLSLE